MTEVEIFNIIDSSIDAFIKKQHLTKIKVSKKAHSDWITFNWRQLTWANNDIEYLIEIFPNFIDEQISSWTFYTAAYYDLNGKRYYLNKYFAQETTLDFIGGNITGLLSDSFKYIIGIERKNIPFKVVLS
ncbi:hypothetical protein [Ferruginibacter albus]|uniref:hypothetical protein n=1 Tax=Ferruginibacter albus TaxID=2875540 RepID=UPI001CC4FF9E|nr:hypothetical protein [Ferruginibacter albus]UAY53365.1 hypothetical protein K9M53_06755 [Ferruginibacter albus]